MRHPLQHLRGNAVRALRSQGVQVDILGEDLRSKAIEVLLFRLNPVPGKLGSFMVYFEVRVLVSFLQEAQKSCRLVNAHLMYRAASRVPFSIMKYAMTLDG